MTRPTMVRADYSLSMLGAGQLLTRVEIVGPSGTLYPIEARSITRGS